MADGLQREVFMRCPECKTLNDENAAACNSCGLLLLKARQEIDAKKPHRRAEDFAGQKRRAADAAVDHCRFCGGQVQTSAVRCQHCGEILNETFYRERARKWRSRLNYASWVAYIFGLGALLLFRPVGLFSIAAGLILSIAYYAVPAEPVGGTDGKPKSLLAFLKRQLRLERVQVPIPNFPKKKLVFVGTPLVAALIGYGANFVLLQEPVNDVLKENSALAGMQVSAHYAYYIVPGVVVYDLKSLSANSKPIDVHAAFADFAGRLRFRKFDRIDLSYRGVTKFSVDGGTFQRLGTAYVRHDATGADFVLNKFPRLVHAQAPSTPGQSLSDYQALLRFHQQWYGGKVKSEG
jgi:predicted nucleic acid-binding Zn ribbon protein